MVWDPKIQLRVLSKSSQMITCVVKLPNVRFEDIISFIYVFNYKDGRLKLWKELETLARDQFMVTKPWAALGDFKQILNPAENSRGYSRITRGMKDFRECIENTGLFDLTVRGNMYTWWNKQEMRHQAKKLD